MRRPLVVTLFLAATFSASSAAADTVLQNIKYSFLDGPLSGTVAEVDYSYPTPPPGVPIFSYNPTPSGSATYLDAVTDDLYESLLVFSGDLEILAPEPYLDFRFDPAASATGLSYLSVWNVSSVGLFFDGAPDILVYSCGKDVDCAFSAEVVAPVPLPAGLPLLAAGLGLLAVAARRRPV